jgi:hypothetical protein
MQGKRLRRTLPPLQEVIFYAQYPGTPFSNQLPPIKLPKLHKEFKHKKPTAKCKEEKRHLLHFEPMRIKMLA